MCFEEWFHNDRGYHWSPGLDGLAFEMWRDGRDPVIRMTWDKLLKAHRLSVGMRDAFDNAKVVRDNPSMVRTLIEEEKPVISAVNSGATLDSNDWPG